ncbi:MAG: biotin--[acetyl-CoA-carboxylase] ligase [Dichotomicrobium sp.]
MDAHHDVTLPDGHRAIFLPETPSTNAHAMRLATQGAQPPLWVWGGRQTKGRGRLGRGWDSPAGNLYASVLLRPDCAAEAIGGLPLLAGLAARDAIAAVASDGPVVAGLRLKWPNDIMLDGAKLGGVLIESAVMDDGARAVVIGTGLNLAAAPSGLDREVACLRDHGCSAAPRDALAALADATARWLLVWAAGAGFAHIRSAWLRHAAPLGTPISVRLGGERIEGRFAGLDETGALRLRRDNGERLITAGDVAIGWQGPGSNTATAHHE